MACWSLETTGGGVSSERKLRTIVQLLAAYGILDSLTSQQQERLLAGMREILKASD